MKRCRNKYSINYFFKIIFSIIVLVNSIYVNAQQTKIDSLNKAINSTKADTSKIVLYENLGQAYRDHKKIDSSILCYQQAVSKNEKYNYSAKKQRDDIGTIDYLLYTEGNYSLSLQYTSKVLQLSEKVKDTFQMAHAHLMFGQNYTSLGNYETALKNYLIAKRLLEFYNHPTVDLESPAATYEFIGELYIKMNRTDSALFYIQKAFSLANKYHFGFVIDYCLRMFGNIALLKNDYASALNYYRQYVSNYNKYNDNNRDICFAYYNMFSIYKERGQIDSAIFYAKQDLTTAQEFHDQENIYSASNVLFELYEKKDEYKKAVNQKNNSYSINISSSDPDKAKIDSLKNLISKTKADTSKIILYEGLAQAYRDAKKPDSSILTYQQALKLNQKINYSPLRQCYNMSTIDYLYYVTGNYTKSLEYASKALMLSEKLRDLPQMAHAHQQFGFNYMAFGNYREALNHFFKAKELFERHNHPEIDLESPAFAIVYIGYIYLKLNQPDSALVYVQSGYKSASTVAQRYVIDFALRIFGDIFLVKNNDQLALNYYRQYTNDFYKYNENNRDVGFVFNNMSKIFKKKGQIDSAILYAKKALASGKEYKDQENIYDAANALFNMNNNDSLMNQAEAFKYFKIATAAKDSMASIEKIRQIQSLEFAEQAREKDQAKADAKAAARNKLIITIGSAIILLAGFLIWNRVRQLRLKYKSILEQKESEKLKTQLLELEAKALRAQMNPHFIFNCMNSIKLLMQQSENEKAINYLTTFSKLIRTIFQNSDKREITLYDEIETCELYTQLESMRFADKFSYTFSIDETIDLRLLMVPALIIQPFIENAIWHGIMPKEDGGYVNITVKRNGEYVLCIIDDDGIGTETSKLNKFKGDAHESKGVHLTQSRIDLDNLINQRNASLEIIDKKDDQGKSTGTTVMLKFMEI